EDGIKTFYAASQAAWREWLVQNHEQESSVWLIIFKKDSARPSVTYKLAVEEALCFGWIDSKPNKRDAESYYQYFSQRKPKSNWSAVNKKMVEKLLSEERMAPAGLTMVQLAKASGTWTALDDVENLVIPPDMEALFTDYPAAKSNWEAFPRSVKRAILEWIYNAKRSATREKRIRETLAKAEQNIRANQYRP
ncbi:MAG: YdeI/OmpD-associated family protein, partial [Bacteroidota bacterium]